MHRDLLHQPSNAMPKLRKGHLLSPAPVKGLQSTFWESHSTCTQTTNHWSPILSSKSIDTLVARVQRFRMRLMRYQFSISHVPGKDLHIADTLSRAPTSQSTPSDDQICHHVDNFVHLVTGSLPVTAEHLQQISRLQDKDEVCQQLKQYCLNGCPETWKIKGLVKRYRQMSSEIVIQGGLLMRNNRTIIPFLLRQEILVKVHTGHQGIHKCRERARQSVWWPGISRQLEDPIRSCPHCCKERLQSIEPLIPTEFPSLPWEKVATVCLEREQLSPRS